jgi:hypothetical protein
MTNLNANTTKLPVEKATGKQDLQQQCLRILRCTAAVLANTPGGLRFKAGTRPWLEGVSSGLTVDIRPPASGSRNALLPIGHEAPPAGLFFGHRNELKN